MTVRGPWYELGVWWTWLQTLAAERLAQKQSYATHRPWNAESDFIGLCGELIWSLYSGQKLDMRLLRGGDGGLDFPGLDVKSTPYWRAAHLLHPVGASHWAEWFALVGIDREQQRGHIFGVASGEALRAARVQNFGNGPQYCIPHYDLAPPDVYLAAQASRTGGRYA